MNTRTIKAGTVDVSVVIRIVDSTDGTPETGVVFNTAGIDLQYRRELAASTAITEATLAALTTAHADGGFLHIGNGYYRLDLPDAACATGTTGVLVHGTVTGMVVIGCYVELVAYDPQSATNLGLSQIDAAISSRMATYTQPTGFLAATFPTGTVANTTNITAGTITTATNLTNNNDKTGYGLSAAAVQAIWDALTTALTTVGSIGKKLADWTIGTAQTGDSFARLGAPAGASVSEDIAAVKVDTAATLIDTAEIGTAGAGLTNITLNAASVDLIWDEPTVGHATAGTTGKALTDAGSAGDPWSTALPGAYGAGTAGKIVGDNINAPIATVDTVVDAIKAKTDSLTFTVANQVDANAQSINDVTILGTGAAGDLWRG